MKGEIIMKKLIPTIGMALLSAAMLGTTTFAWFSANGSASASGLQISAKASASLLISNKKDSGFAATATMENLNGGKAIMKPCTIDEAGASEKALDFKKLTEDAEKHVNSNGTLMEGYDKAESFETTTDDYMKSALYLLYSGEASAKIDATAELKISNAADSIWKSVHVLLNKAETKTKVAEFTFSKLNEATDAQELDIKNGEVLGLDVYIWVEGYDGNCYNANALNGDSYAVSLTFDVQEPAE